MALLMFTAIFDHSVLLLEVEAGRGLRSLCTISRSDFCPVDSGKGSSVLGQLKAAVTLSVFGRPNTRKKILTGKIK